MRGSATPQRVLGSDRFKSLLLGAFSLLLVLGSLPSRLSGVTKVQAQPDNPQVGCYVTDGTVNAVVSTGTVTYIGGTFTQVGPAGGPMQARNNIAALDANGQLTAWNPNANGAVNALLVNGGTVYAGGAFTSIGRQGRNRMAALSAATGAATGWNPNANNTVRALALDATATTIYAGGAFTNIGGQARNRIAALNTGNNNATAWNPNANGDVTALALNDVYVYAGGAFTSIGGQARNRLACLRSDATATGWNPNMGAAVNAISISGVTYWAGGAFTTVGGTARRSVAKFGPVRLEWSTATASGSEGISPVNLQITASEANSLDMSVNHSITGGSATGGGTDYTLAAGTATIPAGSTSANVPLTIVNDLVDEADETVVVTLAGPVNAELGPAITETFTIVDKDTAGVAVSPSGGSTDVAEGGAGDTYTLALTSRPTSNVTVSLSPDAQVTAAPATLTFAPGNWATAQNVSVNAVDDLVAEGPHAGIIGHSANSSDLYYNGLAIASVAANIGDNDTANIVLTQSGGSTSVTEGGATDSFTMVLASRPTADVSMTAIPDSRIEVNQVSLLFTSANWNTPQTVTVSAADDWVSEGSHSGSVSYAVSSADSCYNGFPGTPLSVQVTDNDTAGVTVSPSGGSTDVSEGGSSDTYTVILTSQPTSDVVIGVSPDAQVG